MSNTGTDYTNAARVVLNLCETKYRDDKIIQRLYSDFKTHLAIFKNNTINYSDPLVFYLESLEGRNSTYFLSKGSIDQMVSKPVGRLLDLVRTQAKFESLLFILQEMGEAIEY